MIGKEKNIFITSLFIVLTSTLYFFYPTKYTRLIKKNTYQSSVQVLTERLTPTLTIGDASKNITKKVTRIIDGDTIVIEGGQKVRYIGVDAPEIHSPKKAEECFGKESGRKNEELVLGKKVRLKKDVSEVDRYGRLLRYVYVETPNSGELFVNEELVSQGYAHAATFPPDISNTDRFVQLERQARQAKVGFWLSCPAEK